MADQMDIDNQPKSEVSQTLPVVKDAEPSTPGTAVSEAAPQDSKPSVVESSANAESGEIVTEAVVPADDANKAEKNAVDNAKEPKKAANEKKQASSSDELKKLNVRTYLNKTIVPVLQKGMVELALKRPDDPFEFLANYLRENKTDT